MSAIISGERPPRLRIDRDRIPVGGSGVHTETVTIVNDGGGVLRGMALSDVRWISIPSLKFDTPFVFPFRIEINPEKIPPGNQTQGSVTLVTNGGSAKIIVEFTPHPVPGPRLALDDRNIQFCNLCRGEKVPFDLTLRNTGSGVLKGTIESEADWIEVKTKTIWTRDTQIIPVIIHTASSPQVRQPVGRIRIRSTGGDQVITIPIHFRGGPGPRLRLDPARIRIPWEKKGTIESSFVIHNEGVGLLRGTIPSPVPWLKFIPSIFPVDASVKILLKVDTRNLPGEGTLSIPIPIITNAGRDTLIVEVMPVKRATAPSPARRVRSARYQYRTRLLAYGPAGETLVLISMGRAGGEGEIYQISGMPGRCAKIFHPHRRTGEIEEKLRVMVANPPPADLAGSLTWPLCLLTDLPGGRKAIGYIMRLLPEGEYKPAHLWYDEPGLRDQQGMNRRFSWAHALSRIVSGVHQAGHAIGDLRENNLLINKAGNLVLIDTDSFQIQNRKEGKTYWSRVGTGEYLPPEHLDGSFAREGCDRRSGDNFALAILIFRFLMDGVHPFQAKGPLVRNAPATTDKILLGLYAFESRLDGISPPDYAPPYQSVPAGIRNLFREAFVAGHRRPSVRPDAYRWEKTLASVIPRKEQTRGVHEGQPQDNQTAVPVPDEGTLFTDQSGNSIDVGDKIFRISGGAVCRCNRKGKQVFLFERGIRVPECLSPLPPSPPPSLILPSELLLCGKKPAGWIIPSLDPDRYLPWHMLTDTSGREKAGRAGFTFRHRVACARNLAAALVSARLMDIDPGILTERTVFAGPDSSVRILCVPDILNRNTGSISPARCSSLSILIFRMLMDGYHPFHATGPGIKGYRSAERRMEAGLYPWEQPVPELMPPPGSPCMNTIPRTIRNLFREEFTRIREGDLHGEEDHPHAGPGIWFEVLDQVFSALIGCPHNPNHWYMPGEDYCPWCGREIQAEATRYQDTILFLPLSKTPVACLARPAIAGYLMIPRRFRRRQQEIPGSPRWGVIHLPAERLCCLLLPRPRIISALPGMKPGGILLAPWKRSWMVPVPNAVVLVSEPSGHLLKPEGEIPVVFSDEIKRFMDEVSLIDEMIWTSTADRLRGEGIGLPKKRNGSRIRKGLPSRKAVEIMLMPIDLPWTDEPDQSVLIPDSVPRSERKNARKKGAGKGIRGRLQSMLRNFLEPVQEDT